MGDKHRSEIQKPVKNTLLSGASHGFPFENFQGSSLLIPVSQDSPAVLNDSVGDSNKTGLKDSANPHSVSELTEAVSATNLEGAATAKEPKTPPPTASQGYTGIFSSFFSGGSQKKQDLEGVPSQRKNPDQTSPYPPKSPSPFPSLPPVQSFSPVLQVPTTASEPSHSIASSHSAGVFSSGPFLQSQAQPHSNFEQFSAFGKNPPGPGSVSKPDISPNEHVPSGGNLFQDFFCKDSTSNLGQASLSDIGFEAFYSSVREAEPPASITKAQSAMELFGGSSSRPPSNPPQFPNQAHPFGSTSHFYQSEAGSADSVAAYPPPTIPSSFSAPLPGPPMSSGTTTRNYRRDHQKRLAYAPVPGLTSNTTVSSSYLQPREIASSLSSSALTSPLEVIKQPLSSSFSQPVLNVPEISSVSGLSIGTSNPSGTSLQNFFSTHSSVSSNPQSVGSFEATVASLETKPNQQVLKTESFVSAVDSSGFINPPNPPSLPPPAAGPAYTAIPHAVHPPIMSTREQSQPYVSPVTSDTSPPVIIPQSLNNLANMGTSGIIYRPVYHHWFVRIDVKDTKEIWQPFSMTDSLALEQAFNLDAVIPQTVATDGGRYDVNVVARLRTAVYWEEEPKTVRRCSWFYKSTTESRLHPYDENTAQHLEEEYKKAVTTNTWNRKVDLLSGDYVLMYGPSSMALFQCTTQTPEGWEAEPDFSHTDQRRPKIVKRGVLDDFDIDEGESPRVDHLIFVVHGIGSVCDFKFRTIEEAGDDSDEFLLENALVGRVDGFRAKSLQLVKSHFRSSVEEGKVNRVEVLPVSWHNHLHGEDTGVDKKLQTITLKSIPRLRNFTNDTLLDILFYTSPVYCQNIVHQVGREVNTLYEKFRARNPDFKGGVSLVGHSLGSLILFDMLCNQKPPSPLVSNPQDTKTTVVKHDVPTIFSPDRKSKSLSRNVSYVIGNAGTGQPFIEYPQLKFQPLAFFALGSPIGMFVTVRGIDSLGLSFCLPTCSRFFNVFHPFDPVAYRIEALINPELTDKRPVLIPHHKGRKRMHLELKETMARVGADLKQRLVDSVRSTWNTVYHLTMFGRADDGLEQEVDRVIEKQLQRQRTESVANGINETEETDFDAGRLNQGRRIDYVLQEAPLESFNEYVSALTSHVIYWDSEDTMLLILKEIYGSMGISPDNHTSNSNIAQDSPSPPSPIPSTSQEPGSSNAFK